MNQTNLHDSYIAKHVDDRKSGFYIYIYFGWIISLPIYCPYDQPLLVTMHDELLMNDNNINEKRWNWYES